MLLSAISTVGCFTVAIAVNWRYQKVWGLQIKSQELLVDQAKENQRMMFQLPDTNRSNHCHAMMYRMIEYITGQKIEALSLTVDYLNLEIGVFTVKKCKTCLCLSNIRNCVLQFQTKYVGGKLFGNNKTNKLMPPMF